MSSPFYCFRDLIQKALISCQIIDTSHCSLEQVEWILRAGVLDQVLSTLCRPFNILVVFPEHLLVSDVCVRVLFCAYHAIPFCVSPDSTWKGRTSRILVRCFFPGTDNVHACTLYIVDVHISSNFFYKFCISRFTPICSFVLCTLFRAHKDQFLRPIL